MRRITGLSDAALTTYEEQAEAAMRAALNHVMDIIARRIEEAAPAAAFAPEPAMAMVAAEQPPASSVPGGDGLMPGQPFVSPDDLAGITPLWTGAVDTQLMPVVAQVWGDSTGTTYSQMITATGVTGLPSVGSIAAEQFMAQARNTFVEVGNDLWETARNELLDGFERGESVPQLTQRLRDSADMTAKSAVLLARTQVIEASNVGSIQTARASGLSMLKEWIATMDPRTRPTHLAADGQRVDLVDQFTVGGYSADVPGDSSLPPSERYRCRCTIGYVIDDDEIDRAQGQARDIGPGVPGEVLRPNTGRFGAPPTVPGRSAAAPGPDPLAEPSPDLSLLARGARVANPIRAVLLRAKTTKGLQAAVRQEYRRITGRDVMVVIPDDGSLVTWREYAEGVLRGFERFPEVRVYEIGWFRVPGGDYANAGGLAIRFNASWATQDQRGALLRRLRSDNKGWEQGRSGWFTREGGQPMAVGLHEFGHILDIDNLGARIESRALTAVNRRATLEGIDADTLVARDISTYAGSDAHELVAEAFADVMLRGDRASAISHEIYDLLEAEYRAAGFRLRLTPTSTVSPARANPIGALAARPVAELRTIARQRGIEVPPRATKNDLVRLIGDSPGADVDLIEGRIDQAIIDERRKIADFNARVIQAVVDTEGDRDAIAAVIRSNAARYDVTNAQRDALIRAIRTGGPGKLGEALGKRAKAAGLRELGTAGDVAGYDSKLAQGIAGERLASGQLVRVVRPGYETIVGGQPRLISKNVVESLTSDEATDYRRRLSRTAQRERNRQIETAAANARLIAELDEIIAKGATRQTISQVFSPALRRSGEFYAGVDESVVDILAKAFATGDAAKLRSAITRASTKAGIKPIGKAGAKVKFDPDTMEGFGDIDIPAGAQVQIVTRGATVQMPDGEVIPLIKARVTRVDVGPPSVRSSGTDLTKQTKDDAPWIRRAELAQSINDPQDRVLTEMVRQQPGWSTPGRVVTKVELDKAIRAGWTEMWRGVQQWSGSVPQISARKIAEATRTGDWDMTTGIYGNGVYTTVRRTTAEIYRDSDFASTNFFKGEPWGSAPNYEWLPGFDVQDHGRGGLMRMALDPRARIVDYEDLKAEHVEFLRSLGFSGLGSTGIRNTAYGRSLYDSSFYAAMRGYDGIRIHGPMHNDGAEYPPGVHNNDEPPQYIIFNRSVLIFEKASRRYDA